MLHGETNASLLTSVLRYYAKHDCENNEKNKDSEKNNTELSKLFEFMSNILECSKDDVLDKLDEVLNTILPKHKLHEYGMKKDMIQSWSKSVVKEQQRLLKNSYMPMSESAIEEVYTSTF